MLRRIRHAPYTGLIHFSSRRRRNGLCGHLLARKLVFIVREIPRQRGYTDSRPQFILPTFDRMSRIALPRYPSPLLLGKQLFIFLISTLELLNSLVVVVDGSGERSLGAVLAYDEGIEMGFESCGSYAGWSVCVAERTLLNSLALEEGL